MKLLLMSDSHNNNKLVNEIKEKHQDADYIFHCGDYDSDPKFNKENEYIVNGNSPLDKYYKDELIVDIENHKVFVTHGHFYGVKFNLFDIAAEAKKHNATLVFYGHSHIPDVTIIDDIIIINPGSITRGNYKNVNTYAIITDKIEFYNANTHEVIDFGFSKKYSLPIF